MLRIEYQLSFENYLELTADRRDAPSYRLGMAVAMTGLSLLTIGLVYLWLDPPRDRTFIGGIFLISGLACTMAAVLIGLLFQPKGAKPSLAALRKEYERDASDRRAIEFDEHGWKINWRAGDETRAWSTLRVFYELENLVVLSAAGSSHAIPKSAFEIAGQLGILRSLALNAIEGRQTFFAMPVKPHPLLWVTANLFHSWRQNTLMNALTYVLTTLLIYWVISRSVQPSSSSEWLLICLPIVFFCCHAIYELRRYYQSNWAEAASNARILEEGILYKTPKAIMIFEYRSYKRWWEIPGTFMLYLPNGQFHFIPKENLQAAEMAKFRELLAKHIGDAS